ncbi:MAG TPA: preprotein translocase subunit SecG [Edaphocola sp.]|nr:preprotein translocase subunit SecG [Edaphocola sp.]
MTSLLIVLILIACVVITFLILVQKPKGGGLSGAFGSASSQIMGVQKSGDVMEKGTWYTITIIAILTIASTFTIGVGDRKKAIDQAQKQEQQQQQQQQQDQAPAQ